MWKECTTFGIPLYLIGTKMDLVAESRHQFVEQHIYDLRYSLEIEKSFLISSKNGSGIENTIHSIARDMWLFKNWYVTQKKEGEKKYSFYNALRSKL